MTKNTKNIAIATLAFVDETTLRPSKGGLQRWCWDLSKLLVKKGYSVTIFQKTNSPINIQVEQDIKLVGICAPAKFWGNYIFSRSMAKLIQDNIPIVYVSQELMLGSLILRSVAVNHGIWWDSDFRYWKRWINKIIQGYTLKKSRGVICVDTNYINWCHAEIPRRKDWQHKLRFVPNYADELQFSCDLIHNNSLGARPIRILYPRRLGDGNVLVDDGRGAGFLLKALAQLTVRGVAFEVEFAGPGTLRSKVMQFAEENGFGNCVKCSEYELDQMHIAYSNADIVVIPTLSHEGTSLSAVESMCAGKPTVVTHIGGLPNLVINRLNGFICDLTAESLCESILEAASHCEDYSWRTEAARIAAVFFGKARWERAIWSHLSDLLNIK